MKPAAVVIGDMDLIRPLGLAGIPCVAAGPTGTETRWSRYASGSIDLPDLWEEPEGAVDRLLAFGKKQAVRPILFYQKDPAVLMISRYRDQLGEWFLFVVPERDVVEDLVDKHRFQSRCTEMGLPVPDAAIATAGLDDLPEIQLPVVVKPVLRSRPGETWRPVASGAKAVLCDDRAGLERIWRRPELRGIEVTVQRFVPGDETRIVSYHAFIDDSGRVVGEFCGRKIRTRPANFGISTAVRIEELPQVRDEGIRVLRGFGFTGVAKVDFKETPDGGLALLEVNPRFNLWHHPAAVAGVNLPAAVYHYLTTGVSPPLPPITAGVEWVQVWGDRLMARESGIGLSEWVRFVKRAGARRAFHFDDPGAALGALNHGVMQKLGLASRQ